MDQKIRTAGWRFTGLTVIICGLLALPLGIGLVFSKPSEIWWLGLVLIFCSFLLLYGGISTLYSAKTESRISEIEKKEILARVQPASSNNNAGPVKKSETTILAHWIYSETEWSEFIKGEKKERKLSFIIEIILITLLGGFVLKTSRDTSWITAFGFSLLTGLIIGLLRYKLNLFSISPGGRKMREVIITPDSLLVNGHFNRFYGDNLWLGKVILKDTGKMNVLEITYCWQTRSGETSEEIRVPVPRGKIREAIEVQEKLMAAKN